MSTNESTSGATQGSSGADETTSVDSSQTASGGKSDQVSYDSFKKVLSEKKAVASKLEEMNSELEKLRSEKLQTEGKKDELIQNLTKRLNETEDKLKKSVGSFAYQSIAGVVRAEAVKLGCVDVDALIQLSDISNVDIDENFSPDLNQVKSIIEDAKKKRGYLFKGTTVNVNTVNPGGTTSVNLNKDLSKMNTDELVQFAMKQFGQQ